MATIIFGASGIIGKSVSKIAKRTEDRLVLLNSSNLDLLENTAIAKIKKLVNDGDNVVILSALTPEKASEIDVLTFNVLMMRNILEGLRTINLGHLVYVSSDAVYSNQIENISEVSPKIPSSLYGYAHLIREEMLKREIDSIKRVIIRPCAVYGENDTHNAYGVMQFIRESELQNKISLFGEGEECRDHIYADDIAKIIVEALRSRISGEFNASSGLSVSFHDLATMILSRMEQPIQIKSLKRDRVIKHRFIDNKALLSSFPNFAPRLIGMGLDTLIKGSNNEF
jgi:UDP-glucose 4-epimerase